MKESMFDLIEKHTIYFLTGFVALVSSILLVILLYAVFIAPILFFGGYYTGAAVILMFAMYVIGRNIMKKVN